jgi:dTDP-4-amino-4,6-dideoxygalactose transaminase
VLAERATKARAYIDRIERTTSFRVLYQPSASVYAYCAIAMVVQSGLIHCRDTIMTALADRGIETRSHVCLPLHQQPRFREFGERPLPLTEDLSRRVIELPFYTSTTEAEIDSIVAAFQAVEPAMGHRPKDLLTGSIDGFARRAD